MTDQRDPRLPTDHPVVPAGQVGRPVGPPRPVRRAPPQQPTASRPQQPQPPQSRPQPPQSRRPGDPVAPQRHRPAGDIGPSGPPPRPRSDPSPYACNDMPLLTHDGTTASQLARRDAAGYPGRPGPPRGGRRPGTGAPAASAASVAWRRTRRVLFGTLAVLVLGPVIAFVVGYAIFDAPTGDPAETAQVATFTFADGVPLATVRPDNINRVNVRLDQVPGHVRDAVLAAEDRSFFSNPGFDITGIGRAVWNQLRGGVGGGSTITQQYIKLATGDDSFSLWRKYKEVVLAVKISREQTKEEILENYLNLIYLGRGAYGIQAASQVYFGKDVGRLTVSEAAMLAGVIQSPSRWDPAKNPAKSTERWNFVLDGMAAQGWLSPGERILQQFPATQQPAKVEGGIPGDDRGHIYNLAKAELEQYGITEQMVNTEGLTITTTIDPVRQRFAVDAITRMMQGQPADLRTALVSIDPRTGAIVAYYGGSNGVGTDYAQALRQPGSSFKPFVLAAALQGPAGVGLGTMYDGSSPQEFPGVDKPIQNSEGYDCGRCSVRTAMTRSINTVFYRMALDIGPARVIDAAHQAGIPQDLLPEAQGGIALGDQEVRPIDMASAFGTLAADGKRRPPYLVAKVTAADGRVLHIHDDDETTAVQALPQQVARNVTEAMVDVAGFADIALEDRPVAAKTGTVQHPTQPGQNKDAWTVGFTPGLSTAVWVGTDQSEPIKNSAGRPVYGRMLPGSIWQTFMNEALRGTKVEPFSRFVPMGAPPVSESGGQGARSGDDDAESDDSDDSRSDDSDGADGSAHDSRHGRGSPDRDPRIQAEKLGDQLLGGYGRSADPYRDGNGR